MASDPRYNYLGQTFTVRPYSSCRRKVPGLAELQQQAIETRGANMADSLAKLGNLQILNDVGLGGVGKGLRTIGSISNMVRGGTGSAPSAVGDGVNWALDKLGMNGDQIKALEKFNPAAANTAYGHAKQLYQSAKQGRLDIHKIPEVIGELKNIESMVSGIFGPKPKASAAAGRSQCEASAYAMDLIHLAPKYPFLYVVQFVISKDENGILQDTLQNTGILKKTAFVCQKASRPSVTFETEDVNMYNYRQKVVTKTSFEPLSMTFIDDMHNNVTLFAKTLMEAMSPITRVDDASADLDGNGMDWSNPTRNSASLGALVSGGTVMFSEIVLYHIFNYGTHVNKFHYVRPKVTKIDMGDVGMEETKGNEVTIQFAYDTVHIEENVVMNIEDLTDVGAYPIVKHGGDTEPPVKYEDIGSLLGKYNVSRSTAPTFSGDLDTDSYTAQYADYSNEQPPEEQSQESLSDTMYATDNQQPVASYTGRTVEPQFSEDEEQPLSDVMYETDNQQPVRSYTGQTFTPTL